MSEFILTQEWLKKYLNYNKDTGLFTWINSYNNKIRIGSIAGWVHNVHGKEYRSIMIKKKRYYAHRLACFYVTGSWPKQDTDHINGIGTDNRWSNLRDVSTSDNCRNRRIPLNNKSGVIGVSWEKLVSKWRADIMINSKKTCLGFFDSLEDAAKIRKAAEIEHTYHPNHGSLRTL